jgi:hypothetical protein
VAPLYVKGANQRWAFSQRIFWGKGGGRPDLVKSHICHHPWNVWLFKENFGSHNLRNIAN